MSVREGSRRMQQAGRAIVVFATGIVLVGLLLALIARFAGVELIGLAALPLVILVGFYPALAGALLWTAGWIVEGFGTTTPDNPRDEARRLSR